MLQAKGLDKRRRGNVIWVAPQKEISDYEAGREDARIALEQRISDGLHCHHYGKAKDRALLTEDEAGAGGGGGSASTARRINS